MSRCRRSFAETGKTPPEEELEAAASVVAAASATKVRATTETAALDCPEPRASFVPTVCAHPVRRNPGRITSPCFQSRRCTARAEEKRPPFRLRTASTTPGASRAIPDPNSSTRSISSSSTLPVLIRTGITLFPETSGTGWAGPSSHRGFCAMGATPCHRSNTNSSNRTRAIILLLFSEIRSPL